MERILFVVTSHEKLGTKGKRKTGAHLGEITHAYEILHGGGFEIDFVSPKGGKIPLDFIDLGDAINDRWYHDEKFRQKIENTLKPDQVVAEAYRGLYVAGGHGAMFDLPQDHKLSALIGQIYQNGGVVGAVCHGVAALLEAKEENGDSLVSGKEVTSFTNEEEISVGLWDVVPFLLEDRLVEEGAIHRKVENFQKNVIVSDRLVSGQNPASASLVAEEMMKNLSRYKTSKLDLMESTIAP